MGGKPANEKMFNTSSHKKCNPKPQQDTTTILSEWLKLHKENQTTFSKNANNTVSTN